MKVIGILVAALALFVGGVGATMSFQSEHAVEPVVVNDTATPVTTVKKEATVSAVRKAPAVVPVPVSSVPSSVQLIPPSVLVWQQDFLDAMDENVRDIQNDQKREQRQLEDWAGESGDAVDAYQECRDEIEDIKNDIRAEVAASGGYVSNSQLESMAMDRSSCY